MLSSPPKLPTFSKIREGGLDNGYFLFFKIFKIFYFLQLFLSKKQLEGCFIIIISSYLNRKTEKIRRSSSQ